MRAAGGETGDRVVVFFDGRCPFCIGWVRLLLDRDGHDRLRFASLQSDWTRRFFAEHRLDHPGMGSVVAWDGNRLHRETAALAAVVRVLPGVWRLLGGLERLPRSWRAGAYRFVAQRRYDWFGQRSRCWLPGPEERGKFLDLGDPAYQDAGHETVSENADGADPRQRDL
jgi:predicted DCC family thiol-disulfide oxidoreductase YuxK